MLHGNGLGCGLRGALYARGILALAAVVDDANVMCYIYILVCL